MERLLLISGSSLFLGLALMASCGQNNPHEPPRSIFELRGNHKNLPCETCHGDDGFKRLPTACASCHEDDRPDPDHFPETDCGECHNEFGWERLGTGTIFTDTDTDTDTDTGEVFNHDQYLDLSGGHEVLACADCHLGAPDDYAGLDNDCASCHEDDRPAVDHYVAPEDPPCASCHQVDTDWVAGQIHPFTLPHFAADCNVCHTDYIDRTQFSCTTGGCHEQAETDTIHDAVGAYQYQDALCYSCHPTGIYE